MKFLPNFSWKINSCLLVPLAHKREDVRATREDDESI